MKALIINGLLAVILITGSSGVSLAQEKKIDQKALSPEKYLSEGMKEVSFSGGFGGKIPLRRFDARSDTRFMAVMPSVGYFISDHQELLLEAPILYYYNPQHAVAAGVDVMYRYHFSRNRNFAPFVEIGAGVNYVGLDVRELTGKFQFSLQGGVGVRRKISDHSDLVATLRWHHFSNAGTRAPNIGINDSFFVIGYSRYF